MGRIEKTVFISYRRTNAPWALAISKDLTHSGYDVFFDYTGIKSGDFESAILGNIEARAHFIVLLTPSALKRCSEPGDWLRREIETALELKRNIVPLMLEGFSFKTKSISRQLTGPLAVLKGYQALSVPVEFFDAAMTRLREDYLAVALDAVKHPATVVAREAARVEQAAVNAAPVVTKQELTAQEWFERAFNATDLDEQVRHYSEAIQLDPGLAEAFYNRGIARDEKGDLDRAVEDYSQAIRLRPDFADAFYNRGEAREAKGDWGGALDDYSAAIRLNPSDAMACNNRGLIRYQIGEVEAAIADYSRSIDLRPDYGDAFMNRGLALYSKGDLDGAINDCAEAIRLQPNESGGFHNRGLARHAKGDLDGAINDYTKAIRLKPESAFSYYNRAEIWKTKNQPAAAIADFQQYLKVGGGMQYSNAAVVEKMIRDLQKKL
jgi:tetratricopeptide (TPR) repeat protein